MAKSFTTPVKGMQYGLQAVTSPETPLGGSNDTPNISRFELQRRENILRNSAILGSITASPSPSPAPTTTPKRKRAKQANFIVGIDSYQGRKGSETREVLKRQAKEGVSYDPTSYDGVSRASETTEGEKFSNGITKAAQVSSKIKRAGGGRLATGRKKPVGEKERADGKDKAVQVSGEVNWEELQCKPGTHRLKCAIDRKPTRKWTKAPLGLKNAGGYDLGLKGWRRE